MPFAHRNMKQIRDKVDELESKYDVSFHDVEVMETIRGVKVYIWIDGHQYAKDFAGSPQSITNKMYEWMEEKAEEHGRISFLDEGTLNRQ